MSTEEARTKAKVDQHIAAVFDGEEVMEAYHLVRATAGVLVDLLVERGVERPAAVGIVTSSVVTALCR